MISHIEEEFEKLSLNFIQLKAHAPVINEAANICIQALKNGNKNPFLWKWRICGGFTTPCCRTCMQI